MYYICMDVQEHVEQSIAREKAVELTPLESFMETQFLHNVSILTHQRQNLENAYDAWQIEEPFRTSVAVPIQVFTDWLSEVAAPSGEYRSMGRFTTESLGRIQSKNTADSRVTVTHLASTLSCTGDSLEQATILLTDFVRTKLAVWTKDDAWDTSREHYSIDNEAWGAHIQALRDTTITRAHEAVFGTDDIPSLT